MEPVPPALEGEVLTTGWPRKSKQVTTESSLIQFPCPTVPLKLCVKAKNDLDIASSTGHFGPYLTGVFSSISLPRNILLSSVMPVCTK